MADLIDMIDTYAIAAMAESAALRGTIGYAIAKAYGIEHTMEPEGVAKTLRLAFAAPVPQSVSKLVQDYRIHPQVRRVLAAYGIREDHARAVAASQIGFVTIKLDERTAILLNASEARGRLEATIFLGEASEIMWTFDNQTADEGSGGTLKIAHDLPTTLVVAAIGRPLETVVSHPALDGEGFIIVEACRDGETGFIRLTLASQAGRRLGLSSSPSCSAVSSHWRTEATVGEIEPTSGRCCAPPCHLD